MVTGLGQLKQTYPKSMVKAEADAFDKKVGKSSPWVLDSHGLDFPFHLEGMDQPRPGLTQTQEQVKNMFLVDVSALIDAGKAHPR